MKDEKLFTAEYTDEALEQYALLDIKNKEKILSAIKAFELIGTKYKNINDLGNGLFELKPKGVRAYFKYDNKRKKIIIIGLIVLKKTQKAPQRYIKKAITNIDNYKRSLGYEKKNNNK